ncbi:MAG: glucose 1-dehydrogenase [Actinomycetota bacterium]|nr:MAG: glucose 1-dehydrogenase [Actinomycetota bacterium]
MSYLDDVFGLSGKVALVTGGSRGLGREMVLAFARAGADVLIASRKIETCDEVAEEVRRETGRRAETFAAHMGRWEQADALADYAYETFGRVDILVNNAGMSPLYDGVENVTEKLYDATLNLNLKGPFRLCALVGSRMVRDGGGSIINVSSVSSIRPEPGTLPYGAAKAGLNSLTQGFARALGPTVRVNALLCGPFLTDVSKAWDMAASEAKAQNFASKRLGRPEEIIGAALFLASDASSYTTGSLVHSDGGMP